MTLPLLTLVLGAPTVTLAAEIPGRLFSTPAQRATLDAARQQKVRIDPGAGETAEDTPGPQEVTVNGIIRRNDGKTTVWINHRMMGETPGAPPVELRPRQDASGVTLALPQSSRAIDLKVGQTIDVNTGAVAEPYRRPAPPSDKPPAQTPHGATAAGKISPAPVGQPERSPVARATDRRRLTADDLPPATSPESRRHELSTEH